MKNFLNLNRNLIPEKLTAANLMKGACIVLACSAIALTPELSMASVESSLSAVQDKLVGTLLPLAAMCGLAIAGLSFVAGHPGARQHLVYAIIGAAIGFGAESIVSLIRNLIH